LNLPALSLPRQLWTNCKVLRQAPVHVLMAHMPGTWTGTLSFRIVHDQAASDSSQWMCDSSSIHSTPVTWTFEGDANRLEFTYHSEAYAQADIVGRGFAVSLPEMSGSGQVQSFEDETLTLQSLTSSTTGCRKLAEEKEATDNSGGYAVTGFFIYTHYVSLNAISTSPCANNGQLPACNGAGLVAITGLLQKDSTVQHKVAKGSCATTSHPWVNLLPVDCAAQDDPPKTWKDYLVYMIAGAAGLMACCCCCCVCRILANKSVAWTCLCRLCCYYFCCYGANANAQVRPDFDDYDDENDMKEKHVAKKYRRPTVRQLAGEITMEELEATRDKQDQSVERRKKRRATLSHMGEIPDLAPVSKRPEFQRFEAQTVGSVQPKKLPPIKDAQVSTGFFNWGSKKPIASTAEAPELGPRKERRRSLSRRKSAVF